QGKALHAVDEHVQVEPVHLDELEGISARHAVADNLAVDKTEAEQLGFFVQRKVGQGKAHGTDGEERVVGKCGLPKDGRAPQVHLQGLAHHDVGGAVDAVATRTSSN